ncbi:type IV secretion system protein [Sutcliffiella rhizosphaerae]|uniref:Uncharacterized protein n=1 Tax=Sutcliffiella rhizosphaerae TaxID=2880967 RepID=A0ABM8YS36_9BACI|nr:type IV secretion system protein [Sutcliffiella rhizosphaerae]CAG9622804.1 hypothetical protein BACCIP111883_03595 [Sutcliffiella rhizosphaerae]
MKKTIGFLCLVMLFWVVIPTTLFAEEVTRDGQKHHESSYQLMNYSDTNWHEFGENTSNTIASSVKDFMWMINIIISKVVLMIVYQLFSLDIISLTIDAIKSISSSIADGLLSTFGAFALALFSLGLVVKSYIQQNWQAFLKLLTLVLISLALLFSISSERFDYISFVHGISVEVENMVMNVNPSLTGDSFIYSGDINTTAVALENKVFDALIYKPFLLLQYGTTDESAIIQDDPNRITAYLEADPRTEEGMVTRGEIAEREYKIYDNYNISAANGFSQAGYIMVMLLSTVVQGAVYFFIALLRIMLQFGLVMMLLLAPFAIFLSIFPSFETVVGKYVRALGLIVLFKGVVMFFILVAVSFISLGYDMTNTTDDLYYRIFMQIIMSVATIFLYTKRHVVMNMLEGASLSVEDMGGGAFRMPRLHRGGGSFDMKRGQVPNTTSQLHRDTSPKNSFGLPKMRQSGKVSILRKVGTAVRTQPNEVASIERQKPQQGNPSFKKAFTRVGNFQQGKSNEFHEGNLDDRYAQQEVAAAKEKDASSGVHQIRQSNSSRFKTDGKHRKDKKEGVTSIDSSRNFQHISANQDLPSTSTKSSSSRKVVPPKKGNNLTKAEAQRQVDAQKSQKSSHREVGSLSPSARAEEGNGSPVNEETQSRTPKIMNIKTKRDGSKGRLGRSSRLNQNN